MSYFGLFLSAFLAASLLPFYSEFALPVMLRAGYAPWGIWIVATLGNTLGAVLNWVLGRYCQAYKDRRWFPFKAAKLVRAQAWFQRYGTWSLLLAWLPIGGDALTFIAGLMRVRLGLFLLLVAAGKGARYALVLLALTPLWP